MMRYPIIVTDGYMLNGEPVITSCRIVGYVVYSTRPPRREKRRARKRRGKQ